MRIKEFCEKYGVSRRSIDYWTYLGLLHPEVHENGYRDYGEQAESEIEYIFIASIMNRPESLKNVVNDIRNYDEKKWRKCISEMQNQQSNIMGQYDIAYKAAMKNLEEAE